MKIRSIQSEDFDRWLPLWEGYNDFYKRSLPPSVTEKTWKRFLDPQEPMFAMVAEENQSLVGLVHYLFHLSTSMSGPNCYLQDLFTAESARGRGVGRGLIFEVYDQAKQYGAERVYWQTHESNVNARSLYDQIATNSGFIIYRKTL